MSFILGVFGVAFSVYFWVRLRQLEERTRQLRKDLESFQHPTVIPTPSTAATKTPDFEEPVVSTGDTVQNEAKEKSLDRPVSPESTSTFGDWLREDFLVKIGALFVILGAGWLMNYLYVQQILSLEIILAAVFGTSLAVALVGDWQISRRAVAGQLIFLTGIATAVVTVLAATNLFDLLDVPTGLGVSAGLALLILWRAVHRETKYLSYVGLGMLFSLPIFMETEAPNWFFLANYGLLVSGLGVCLHLWRRWSVLGLLAFVGTAPYFYAIASLEDLRSEYAFIYLVFFWGSDVLLHWIDRAKWGLALTRSLCAVALVGILNQGLISAQWRDFIWIILAVASLGVAYLFRYGRISLVLGRTYFLYALFYALCFVVAEWSGLAYLPVIIASGLLLSIALVHQTLQDSVLFRILATGQTLPLIMTLYIFDQENYLPNMIGVSLAAAITTGLTYLRRKGSELDDTLYKTLVVTTLLATHASVWEILRRLFENNSLAAGVSLLLFTIGPVWWLYRVQITDRFWRGVSWVILSFVVLRLLSVEVWAMTPLIRVLTFVGVGVWFILTAYLRKEKQVR